jgi:hypothetical protein
VLSSPQIVIEGSTVTLRWIEESIVAVFDRWGKTSDASPKAELTVTTGAPGFASHLLGPMAVNLTGPRSRPDLAKQLQHVAPDLVEWMVWAEQALVLAIRAHRQGDPIQRLTPALPGQGPSWRVQPLLYDKLPTVVFGAGGTGKSYLCLWLALMIETGGLLMDSIRAVPGRALYLDYESDATDAQQRLARLLAGNEAFKDCLPLYRRMTQPLAADMHTLNTMIGEHGVDVLIIDSLAMACGGKDLNDPSTAVAYFSALRQLHVTSLSVAHVPKNTENPTIYGGVFFTNIARSCWEAVGKTERQDEQTIVNLGLFHRKQNQRPEHPVGLQFTHSHQDERTTVEATTITDNAEFIDSAPIPAQIRHYLKDGAKTTKTLALLTGKPMSSIVSALQRGEERGRFLRIGEGRGAEWVIPPESSEPI